MITATLIIFASIIAAGMESGGALMYVNDSPWPYEAQYPQADIFHTEYLPCSMFKALEGVNVRENKYLRNVVISYGDGYITFDLNNSMIYTSDGGNISAATYLLYVSERYVPAEITCTCLGLKYEKIGDAVRISDDSAKKSFNALLLEYNASLAQTEPATETEPPPQTEPIETEPTEIIPTPIVTDEPKETEPEPEREVYLTFVCGGGYESEIAAELKKQGLTAAFFCDKKFMEESGTIVRTLADSGNTVGLFAEADAALKDELSAANRVLYILTKSKTHLFSCKKTDCERLSGGADLEELNTEGYVLCDFNCDIYYDLPVTKSYLLSAVKKYIDGNIISVLRFNTDSYSCQALPEIFTLLNEYYNLEVGLVSETSYPLQ